MTDFDPWTATIEEASLQEKPGRAFSQVNAATIIKEKAAFYQQNPLDGVAYCVRYGLTIPKWLVTPFIGQYDRVKNCELKTWDEAFGPAHPSRLHLSALKLRLRFASKVWFLFNSENKFPRTPTGYQDAANLLGITVKQVLKLLPKTRANTKGHKSYQPRSGSAVSANNPFSL